jgi:hypothetical protein
VAQFFFFFFSYLLFFRLLFFSQLRLLPVGVKWQLFF